MRARARLRRLGTVLVLLAALLLPLAADAASLRRGSRGDGGVTLRKRLQQWGSYAGAVAGIFGIAVAALAWLVARRAFPAEAATATE